MRKYKCSICGYVHTGSSAPECCPGCKSPASKFIGQNDIINDIIEDKKIISMVGKWVNDRGQFYVFSEDGKFMTNVAKGGATVMGTYMFVDNMLAISVPGYDVSGRRYVVNGDDLDIIVGGEHTHYKKQS
ncbi:hypothetical protein AGMMS50268_39760 [Spirochaetia bacterium]|nr:hypothetical protein AGMMS50268_39760 [Spirochaetia bacterium]